MRTSSGGRAIKSAPDHLRDSASRWLILGVCLGLAVVTLAVFGQTLRHGFINYDDDKYVYENGVVMSGLSFSNLAWAVTHVHSHNWHPLTTLSHMLDCDFYGLRPSGHHLTNVLLHIASVVLLFLTLHGMTLAPWRSAFVAALFAVHPLHVESVAWVAERKDVLSGVFFLLTLWVYLHYTRRPTPGRYLLVAFCFVLGLLSKPMLVSLPFVLMLLDYWPLQRFSQPAAAGRSPTQDRPPSKSAVRLIILEKLPLVGLSAASAVITLFAQKDVLEPVQKFPLTLRIGNALVSSVAYAWQTIWPANLTVFYPYPTALPALEVMGAISLLVAVIVYAIAARGRRPYFITGLAWYLIMLLPVIGIVQVGAQARADRYTYLPQIGLCILATWAVADLTSRRQSARKILAIAGIAVLMSLAGQAWFQTQYWRDSETLWRHTIAVTGDNDVALNNLGAVLFKQGKEDEGSALFEAALRVEPDNPSVHDNLAKALLKKGEVQEAMKHYNEMLQIEPASAPAHVGLGKALLRQGRIDEALRHDKEAIILDPDLADAHLELGNALVQKGEIEMARSQYRKMIELQPVNPAGYFNLAVAFHREHRLQDAITYYQKALALKSDFPKAREYLAEALRESGRGPY
jgi:tetratricopeptide (TPR) repeat protein